MDISYYKKYEPIDGKWYITKELGSGAYGTVFEVERKDYGNMKAAMKVITIPSSPSELKSFRSENYDLDEQSVTSYFYGFVEEFVKEFQLMAELKGHSNIVSYEDHDIVKHSDGIGWDIFIRMELLKSMNDHYADNPPTVDEVVKLGIHICKALEVCKESNIIHRDIKPSNIFVSRTGEYKLGDFGVARTLEKTSSGLSKKGTYTYMAPEVFKGESYGANVDIYSLGIVMYRLLNNNLEPFRTDRTYANAEMALEKRMKGEELPAPLNADDNLSKIILKACSYSPKERYQSATEMREALESLTVGEVKEPFDNLSMDKNVVDTTDKTESIFAISSSRDEAVVVLPNESNTGINTEKTVGLFSEEKNLVLSEEKQNDNKKQTTKDKGKGKKAIIISCISVLLIVIVVFGIFAIKSNDDNKSNTITDIAALIEITDEDNNIILDNDEIVSVEKAYDSEMGYYLLLNLNVNGQNKFFDYTKESLGEQALIYINKSLVSAPSINEAINTTEIAVSGNFSEEDIDAFIQQLNTKYDATGDNEVASTNETLTENSEKDTEETDVAAGSANVKTKEYDFVADYIGDRALVRKNGKCGFIDKTGQLIIPCEYDDFTNSNFKHGVIGIQKNGKWGCIDKNNKILIPFEYDGMYHPMYILSKCVALAEKNGKKGLLDVMSNKVILNFEYDQITNFDDPITHKFEAENGLIRISKNGLYGVADLRGNILAECIYEYIQINADGTFEFMLNGEPKTGSFKKR